MAGKKEIVRRALRRVGVDYKELHGHKMSLLSYYDFWRDKLLSEQLWAFGKDKKKNFPAYFDSLMVAALAQEYAPLFTPSPARCQALHQNYLRELERARHVDAQAFMEAIGHAD
jgi:hypothetical protein